MEDEKWATGEWEQNQADQSRPELYDEVESGQVCVAESRDHKFEGGLEGVDAEIRDED